MRWIMGLVVALFFLSTASGVTDDEVHTGCFKMTGNLLKIAIQAKSEGGTLDYVWGKLKPKIEESQYPTTALREFLEAVFDDSISMDDTKVKFMAEVEACTQWNVQRIKLRHEKGMS